MNETTPLPPPSSRPDIDGVLRGYFRSVLPDPWPDAPAVEYTRSSWWGRAGSRLAIAASVALLLLSYLALAGRFPPAATPTQALPLTGPQIGDRPTHHRTAPRPTAELPDWGLNVPPTKNEP